MTSRCASFGQLRGHSKVFGCPVAKAAVPPNPKSSAFTASKSDLTKLTEPCCSFPHSPVRRGEFVTIVGPSGCGKSTVLRLIAGLLPPTRGTVSVNPDPDSVRCRIGFVFQDATLLPWRTAVGNVLLPAELGARATPPAGNTPFALRLAGLPDSDADKRPGQLSGGMRMRVSLARALVTEPKLLLLDEPFAALDDILRSQLQQEVRRIHNQCDVTTVLVTHNIHEAVFMSDRVLVMGGSRQPSSVKSRWTFRNAESTSSGRRRSSCNSSAGSWSHCTSEFPTATVPPMPYQVNVSLTGSLSDSHRQLPTSRLIPD
ncbi:MAG: ATP-binding cassette domain-containing protein [Planctomycetaceae bacterium]